MSDESPNTPPMREWMVVVVSVVLAVAGFLATGRSPASGDEVAFEVTVLPQDEFDLGCASHKSFDGLNCEYRVPQKNAPSENPDPTSRLAPYVTTDGRLVILSGVFAYDAVRVASEKHRRKRPQARRFTVRCRARLLERVQGLPIRFARDADFKSDQDAWLARTLECIPRP